MRYFASIGLVLFFSYCTYSQPADEFKVPAGATINDIIPFNVTHQYADFKRCNIKYLDGTSSLAMVNYNLLTQKMQFISVKSDTGYLNNVYSITQFDFGNELWVNNNAFGLIQVNKDTLYPKLGKREFLNIIQIDEGTTNGYSSFTDPSHSNGSIRSGRISGKRDVEAELASSNRLVRKEVTYYLIDKNRRVVPAKGPKVYKILPRYKEEIRAFIKNEKIDFKSETDLQKLTQFCQQL
jgi:hypothetical protein